MLISTHDKQIIAIFSFRSRVDFIARTVRLVRLPASKIASTCRCVSFHAGLLGTITLTSERGLFLRLKTHHLILIATSLKLLAIAIPRLILKAVTRVLKILFCLSTITGFFA